MLLEHFQGVFLLVKRNGQHLVHLVMRQVRAHLKFEEFGNKQREKIWHSLPKGGDVSWKICNSVIREISEWQLNGHEIEHLFQNLRLLVPLYAGKDITAADMERLRDLTSCPVEEWSRPGSRSESVERATGRGTDTVL